MNQTTNYKLNQWEADDRVQRVDFNADNAKIDAALAGLARTAAEEHILMGSYVGDGDKSRVVQLPWAPKFMLLISYVNEGNAIYFLSQEFVYYSKESFLFSPDFTPKLQGSSLMFHHENWGNNSGKTMYYILFR